MVRSPTTLPGSNRVEANVISGWRSASKKSGDWRCPSRASSRVSTLATRIAPEMRGSSPPSMAPSKSAKLPWIGAMPRCRIENSTREWLGSIFHVPVGIATCCVSSVLIVLLLPMRYT